MHAINEFKVGDRVRGRYVDFDFDAFEYVGTVVEARGRVIVIIRDDVSYHWYCREYDGVVYSCSSAGEPLKIIKSKRSNHKIKQLYNL